MTDIGWHTTWLAQDSISSTRQTILTNFGLARRPTVVHYTSGPQTLAEDADLITADLTSGAFTVNLPLGPNDGDTYEFAKVDSSVNALTIGRNGKLINGVASNSTIGTQWEVKRLTWCNTANSWLER